MRESFSSIVFNVSSVTLKFTSQSQKHVKVNFNFCKTTSEKRGAIWRSSYRRKRKKSYGMFSLHFLCPYYYGTFFHCQAYHKPIRACVSTVCMALCMFPCLLCFYLFMHIICMYQYACIVRIYVFYVCMYVCSSLQPDFSGF